MPTEATHRVFNQVPDLTGFNPFTSDTTLQNALERLGGGWNASALQAFGDQLGAPRRCGGPPRPTHTTPNSTPTAAPASASTPSASTPRGMRCSG